MKEPSDLRGWVNDDLELILKLVVAGPDARSAEIESVIDTGFSGALTLPVDLVERLQLQFARYVNGELADGSQTVVPLFFGNLRWADRLLEVEVAVAGASPLVGVQPLNGYRLIANYVPNGAVAIERLS